MRKTLKMFAIACVASLSCAGGPVLGAQAAHSTMTGGARPAITGIAFIRFYETDPAAAQHFYKDTLGFDAITASDGNTQYPVNSLQWVETVPQAGPLANDRLAAVGFTTRNAAALERYLAAHGYPADQPLQHGMFSLHDPEGNLVTFVQEGANAAVSHSPVSARASSHRVIHVGFLVEDRAKEDVFWRDTLGFKMYWHGTGKDETVGDDYVSQQVPEGTDWLEYMMHVPRSANLQTHGVLNHFSLGVANMQTAVNALKANGCTDANCSKTQLGRDGKVQLNVFDPDLSRVEFMEFKPRETPCCSPITGPAPTEVENR